jgi:hypothetical protein
VIGDVEDEDAVEEEEDIWDRSIIEDLAEILMVMSRVTGMVFCSAY